MKSPIFKIQSPVPDLFIKIEPICNPEPNSVPPLISDSLVTVPAVYPSGQPLAPDVRDATSVAASLSAWDGYPDPSLMPQQVDAPAICPYEPSVNTPEETQPSSLPQDVDTIVPMEAPDLSTVLIDYDDLLQTLTASSNNDRCDTITLMDSEYAASPELVAPLFQAFNIYRDTYPCFRDEEYSKLPKPSLLRSLFYTTLV